MIIDSSRLSASDSKSRSLVYSDSQFTSSTVPGPGAISGKAIKSLGELTLRGLDRIIIYTRLRSALAKFPHNDAQAESIKGIDAIYDTILELSRPGLYTPSIRNAAISVIFAQIIARQTQRLVLALRRWNPVELELFFHSIMPLSSFTDITPHWQESIYSDFTLHINETILLMSRVALTTDATCQLVLNMGYFDLIDSIDVAELFPDEIADICSTVFLISTRLENNQSEIARRGHLFLTHNTKLLNLTFNNGLLAWADKSGSTFENCYLPPKISPFFATFTHLRLAKVNIGLDESQFYEIFRELPGLVELYLDRLSFHISKQTNMPHMAPVAMPCLSILTISSSTRFCSHFLQHLILPTRPSLHLVIDSADGIDELIASICQHMTDEIRPIRYISIQELSRTSLSLEAFNGVNSGPAESPQAGESQLVTLQRKFSPDPLLDDFSSQATTTFLEHRHFKMHLQFLRLRGSEIGAAVCKVLVDSLENVHTVLLDLAAGISWLALMIRRDAAMAFPGLRTISFTESILPGYINEDAETLPVQHTEYRLLRSYLNARKQRGQAPPLLQLHSDDLQTNHLHEFGRDLIQGRSFYSH